MSKSPDYFQVNIPGSNDMRVAQTAAKVASLPPWASKFKPVSPIFTDAVRTIAVSDPTMAKGPQISVTRLAEIDPDFGAGSDDPNVTDIYLLTGPRASDYVARVTAGILTRQWENSPGQRIGRVMGAARRRLSNFGYIFGRVGE